MRKGEKIAKFWVEPEVALESAYEMSSSELKSLQKIVEEKQDLIRRSWNEHFR